MIVQVILLYTLRVLLLPMGAAIRSWGALRRPVILIGAFTCTVARSNNMNMVVTVYRGVGMFRVKREILNNGSTFQ